MRRLPLLLLLAACGDPTGFCEAYAIVHLDATFGGALCCKD